MKTIMAIKQFSLYHTGTLDRGEKRLVPAFTADNLVALGLATLVKDDAVLAEESDAVEDGNVSVKEPEPVEEDSISTEKPKSRQRKETGDESN